MRLSMGITTQPASQSSKHPLGVDGDHGRRFFLHHLPLAFPSAVVLVVFTSLPLFDTKLYPHGDIISGTLPQQPTTDHIRPMGHGPDHSPPMGHGPDHTRHMPHGTDHAGPMHDG